MRYGSVVVATAALTGLATGLFVHHALRGTDDRIVKWAMWIAGGSIVLTAVATILGGLRGVPGLPTLPLGVLSSSMGPGIPIAIAGADGERNDLFGRSLALDGETLVVGAEDYTRLPHSPAYAQRIGKVYIFERLPDSPTEWRRVKLLRGVEPPAAASNTFGHSLAIGGDVLVVGDSNATVNGGVTQGRVHLFERSLGGPSNWGELQVIEAPDGRAQDEFGMAVAIDGDTLVVGAAQAPMLPIKAPGKAYVYERGGARDTDWRLVKMLTATAGEVGAQFGSSAAISGDTIVIGAWGARVGGNRSQGKAYVFERHLGGTDNWGLSQVLVAADGAAADRFSYRMSMDGDRLLLNGTGRAYIFERDHQVGAWRQTAVLTLQNGRQADSFGESLSLSGDAAAVGVESSRGWGARPRDAVYMFERSADRGWRFTHRLSQTDVPHFGAAVVARPGIVIVGAPVGRVTETYSQGAVFVYHRPR